MKRAEVHVKIQILGSTRNWRRTLDTEYYRPGQLAAQKSLGTAQTSEHLEHISTTPS